MALDHIVIHAGLFWEHEYTMLHVVGLDADSRPILSENCFCKPRTDNRLLTAEKMTVTEIANRDHI